MTCGTTQPGRSEDLWAKVAATQPWGPHAVADPSTGGVAVEGRSKLGTRAGA